MTPSTLRRLTASALLAALLPTAAMAQEARAAKAVNVRAGPGKDYPLVVQLGAGTPLAVQGCLDNYSWCDVVVPGPNYRGWVYAGNIAYAYQRTEVPLLEYGAAIGLPIIGFTLGSYWGDYYRNRPFYRDRGRWEHRPVPHGPIYRGPPPRDFGHPGPGARPPGEGRFPGGGRPGGGRPGEGRPDGRPGDGRPDGGPRGDPGRGGDGGRPGFGRGGDPGARPDRGRPDGDRGRPDGGRGGPGGGGRPGGGGQGQPGGGNEGRPGR